MNARTLEDAIAHAEKWKTLMESQTSAAARLSLTETYIMEEPVAEDFVLLADAYRASQAEVERLTRIAFAEDGIDGE